MWLKIISWDFEWGDLRRICCHDRNLSHAHCENSQTIFFCSHHCSEYSLLGSKFSICYSQRVNAIRHNTMTVVVQDVQNGRMMGLLQWRNIAGSLYKEEGAAEKDNQRLLLDRCSRKCFHRVIVIAWFRFLWKRATTPMFIKLSYSCDDKKLFEYL